jgi:hypothetical protein
MKPVGDLPRLRRPFSRRLGKQTATVSADDFDLKALLKPISRYGGRAANTPPTEAIFGIVNCQIDLTDVSAEDRMGGQGASQTELKRWGALTQSL